MPKIKGFVRFIPEGGILSFGFIPPGWSGKSIIGVNAVYWYGSVSKDTAVLTLVSIVNGSMRTASGKQVRTGRPVHIEIGFEEGKTSASIKDKVIEAPVLYTPLAAPSESLEYELMLAGAVDTIFTRQNFVTDLALTPDSPIMKKRVLIMKKGGKVIVPAFFN